MRRNLPYFIITREKSKRRRGLLLGTEGGNEFLLRKENVRERDVVKKKLQ